MKGLATGVREIFGIPLAAVTMAEAITAIERAIASRDPLMVGVVNAAKIVTMRRDPELRDSVLSSDLILADGFSVVLASRLMGRALPARVAGIDLMHEILARGNTLGYRVFCLGATDEVLTAALAAIRTQYPGVCIAGAAHGFFTPAEEPALADRIRASGADVLFVAMTSPKKERFLHRWGPGLGIPVCHGVGGSFDVLAGKVRRAPQVWQRFGCEWLYRVLQEPGRLWRRYLVTNTLFLGMLAAELLRTMPRRLARHPGTHVP